jgi:MFS family permease
LSDANPAEDGYRTRTGVTAETEVGNLVGSTASADEALDQAPRLNRNRDYLLWFAGESLSVFGSALSSIALPLLLLAQRTPTSHTGSAAVAGGALAVFYLALIAVSIPGGLIADRFPRRILLAWSAIVQFIAVGSVATVIWTGHVVVLQVYAMAAVQGAASAVYNAAATPALMRIVGPKRIASAYANSMSRVALITLIGPPLGVLLFSVAKALPFSADSVSFLFVVLAAMLLRKPLGPDPAHIAAEAGEPLHRRLTAGMRFIWGHPTLRAVNLLVGLANMVLTGIDLVLIILVKYRSGSPSALALVILIVAICALIGSVVAGRAIKLVGNRRLLQISLVFMFAGVALAAVVPNPIEIGLSIGLVVFAAVPLSIALMGYGAAHVPDELRGRAGAAGQVLTAGLQWLGPLVGGISAQIFGPAHTMIGLDVLLSILFVWTLVAPAFRGLDKP